MDRIVFELEYEYSREGDSALRTFLDKIGFTMSQNQNNNPYKMGQYQLPDRNQGETKTEGHSVLGIISFVTSIVSGISTLALFGTIWVMGSSSEDAFDENSILLAILGFGILGATGCTFFGGLIGLIGVAIPNGKKIFAIIGMILNGLIFLAIASIMVFGLVAS